MNPNPWGGGGQPYKSNFELSNKRILTMNPNPWGGGGGGGEGGRGGSPTNLILSSLISEY